MTHIFQSISLLIVTSFVTACSATTPTLGYGRTPPTVVEVGGNSFRVFTNQATDSVEAHRTNVVFPPPSRMLIVAQAHEAIVQATGCEVKNGTLVGDQAIVKASLDCPDA